MIPGVVRPQAPAPPAFSGPPPRPQHGYRYRPPKRTATGSIVAVFGAVATVMVIAVVVLSLLTREHRTTAQAPATTPRGTAAEATRSKLYGTGALSPEPCHLPKIGKTAASMRAFMDTLSDCLDTAWRAQFGKAGLAFTPATRMFWTQPGRGACGSYPVPGTAAFYCPANNTMYVGLTDVVGNSGNEPVSHYAVYARVIAHEYGHHVQQESGILDYGHQLMAAPDLAGRTEASRRIELQAQCFAGAFLSAEAPTLPMTKKQYRYLLLDVRSRGDDGQPLDKQDHGSNQHYAGWVVLGYRQKVLAACNTWTVPGSAVS
jgi:predicted metalloprotease